MKILGILKALQIVSIVSTWSVKALEDGKVSRAEGEELINGICKVLDVPVEVDLTPEG